MQAPSQSETTFSKGMDNDRVVERDVVARKVVAAITPVRNNISFERIMLGCMSGDPRGNPIGMYRGVLQHDNNSGVSHHLVIISAPYNRVQLLQSWKQEKSSISSVNRCNLITQRTFRTESIIHSSLRY